MSFLELRPTLLKILESGGRRICTTSFIIHVFDKTKHKTLYIFKFCKTIFHIISINVKTTAHVSTFNLMSIEWYKSCGVTTRLLMKLSETSYHRRNTKIDIN